MGIIPFLSHFNLIVFDLIALTWYSLCATLGYYKLLYMSMAKKYLFYAISVTMVSFALPHFVHAIYEVRDGAVYFRHYPKIGQEYKVENADINTFQTINDNWAKDKNRVYSGWETVEGAGPANFHLLNNGFWTDNINVYLYDKGYVVQGADPATFEVIKGDYDYFGSGNFYFAKDKNKILFIDSKTVTNPEIQSIDRESFEIIDMYYSKDKNSVYYKNTLVAFADHRSFKIIKGNVKDFGVDENYVYCDGKKLENSDSKTFEVLDSYNAKDKNNVYESFVFGCSIVNNDASSFTILDRNYQKDSKGIYIFGRKIEHADPASFEFVDDIIGKDKNYVYYLDHIIVGANPASFQYLNYGYSKDDDQAFYHDKEIKGADAKTFRVIRDVYAEDDFSTYYRDTVQKRRMQAKTIKNKNLYNRLRGRIILQVESRGEAYYIHPDSGMLYYLSRPENAFEIMRGQGIGIKNSDLEKIPVADNYCPQYNLNCDNKHKHDQNFAAKQKGKIFLQVENRGEAWYVNPINGKRYFLGKPQDAYGIMRSLGLGISNNDFQSLLYEAAQNESLLCKMPAITLHDICGERK